MNLAQWISLAVTSCSLVACGGNSPRPVDPTSKQSVDAYVRDVLDRGDVAAADRYLDPALVDHAPWPGQPATVAGFKAGLTELRAAFPDLRVTVERQVAEGDTVVAHMTMTGTHKGTFMGVAPTGKRFKVEMIDIVTVRNGKIAEHWGVMDEAGMAAQLGLAK